LLIQYIALFIVIYNVPISMPMENVNLMKQKSLFVWASCTRLPNTWTSTSSWENEQWIKEQRYQTKLIFSSYCLCLISAAHPFTCSLSFFCFKNWNESILIKLLVNNVKQTKLLISENWLAKTISYNFPLLGPSALSSAFYSVLSFLKVCVQMKENRTQK
jgi:hypothetical protein